MDWRFAEGVAMGFVALGLGLYCLFRPDRFYHRLVGIAIGSGALVVALAFWALATAHRLHVLHDRADRAVYSLAVVPVWVGCTLMLGGMLGGLILLIRSRR